MITCVLADDHPPILDSISRFLAGKGIDVVATAADGEGR
jgi:DNA-binding NarL/FixJ family response regulator